MVNDDGITRYSNYPKASRFGSQKRSTLAIRAAEMNNLDVFDELCKEALAAPKGSKLRIQVLSVLASFIAPKLKLVEVRDTMDDTSKVDWNKMPLDLLIEVRKQVETQEDLQAGGDADKPIN